MAIRNLTPHPVQFFQESQFEGLEQLNPTTFIADGVSGIPLLSAETEGMARVSTETVDAGESHSIPLVSTEYGELTGVPSDVTAEDLLVVSLPTLSMAKSSDHPLAGQMACPYRVVRQRGNTSMVLGAMGLSK